MFFTVNYSLTTLCLVRVPTSPARMPTPRPCAHNALPCLALAVPLHLHCLYRCTRSCMLASAWAALQRRHPHPCPCHHPRPCSRPRPCPRTPTSTHPCVRPTAVYARTPGLMHSQTPLARFRPLMPAHALAPAHARTLTHACLGLCTCGLRTSAHIVYVLWPCTHARLGSGPTYPRTPHTHPHPHRPHPRCPRSRWPCLHSPIRPCFCTPTHTNTGTCRHWSLPSFTHLTCTYAHITRSRMPMLHPSALAPALRPLLMPMHAHT